MAEEVRVFRVYGDIEAAVLVGLSIVREDGEVVVAQDVYREEQITLVKRIDAIHRTPEAALDEFIRRESVRLESLEQELVTYRKILSEVKGFRRQADFSALEDFQWAMPIGRGED
jgi:hypothetical protein